MMMSSLPSDLRQVWRMMKRSPIVAGVVIGSLGIGIGVNTAVFSWVQAVVLRPLPGVADAASFQLIESRTENGAHPGSSWLEYRDLRTRLPSLPNLLAFRMAPFTVGAADHAERSYGLLVSDNYFSALGFDIAVANHLFAHGTEGSAGFLDGAIESDGEEAGFEAITAQDGLLAERDALDGEQFLGIGGAITGDGVGFEVRDLIEFFEAHDGEGSTAEGVPDERIFRVKRQVEIGHG